MIHKTFQILPIEGMSPIFTSNDLGEIDVNLQLLTKNLAPSGNTDNSPELTIRTQVVSSNEYTTSWVCDCIADFQISKSEDSSPEGEKFHITVGYDGLVLDSLMTNYLPNVGSDDVTHRLAESTLHQFQKKTKETLPPGWDGTPPVVIETIEYHLFQNQRRSMGLWGNNFLHSNEFEFTDESGTVNCPFTPYDVGIDPPEGFSWEPDYVTQWVIDREYTSTDQDGWSYGLDFGSIAINYREGKSATSSAGVRACRRRRWKRIAKKVTPLPVTSLEQTPFERDSKVLDSLKGTYGFDEDDESPDIEDEGDLPIAQPPDETKIFEIFENQRRSVTLDWGKKHLFSAERSPFSDETGEITYHYSSLDHNNDPPAGYEWVDWDWKIDTTYTNTDEAGWVYGIDFTWIMSNLQKGRSTTSSVGRSVRRRKFTRRMRKINKSITHVTSFEYARASQSKQSLPPKEIKSKLDLYQLQNQNLIMSLCQERETISSSVLVPWAQILSCDVVSPTVLRISVLIHRYFGQDPNQNEIYRPVEMKIFILDCPSEKISQLIFDRQRLEECRENIMTLISSGNMTGRRDSQYLLQTHAEVVGDDNQVQFIPEDLSLGSSTNLYLDKEILKLATLLEQMKKYQQTIYVSTSNSLNSPLFVTTEQLHRRIQIEIHHLEIKRIRFLLYVASLLEASLSGPSYDEAEVKQMIQLDYKAAERLYHFIGQEQNHEMDAAKQMIDYLLETSEMRIRDTALCGWAHRGPTLEKCLGILINGYFTQIIGVLGRFFESKEGLMTLKVRNMPRPIIIPFDRPMKANFN